MKLLSLIVTAFMMTFMALSVETRQEMSITIGADALDYHRLTYVMVHSNVIHLLINIYCFLSMVFLCGSSKSQFLVAMAIAIAIPDCILYDTPMCGMSVLNFALTGMVTALSKRKMLFIAMNAVFILPTFFISSIAVYPHIYGFVAGFVVQYAYSLTSGALLRYKESCVSPHNNN